MDLTKAYEKIPQKNLFEVFMHELKIDKSTLKCLMHMYTNIKASVCMSMGPIPKPFQYMKVCARAALPAHLCSAYIWIGWRLLWNLTF